MPHKTQSAGQTRNAAATRERILEAARRRFACEGYDHVGIRDIAGDAGVDAALVCRYFGSKDGLLEAVLDSGPRAAEILEAGADGLAAHAADLLAEAGDFEESKLLDLLIMLHAAGSPKATPIIRESIKKRFHDPFAELIGGPDAGVRVQAFGAVVMGVMVSRMLNGDFPVTDADRDRLRTRFEAMLNAALAR